MEHKTLDLIKARPKIYFGLSPVADSSQTSDQSRHTAIHLSFRQ